MAGNLERTERPLRRLSFVVEITFEEFIEALQ